MRNTKYRLKEKMNEVFCIQENNLGFFFLTRWYKKITSHLKQIPFIYIIPLSFLCVLILYILLGRTLILLISRLRYGF